MELGTGQDWVLKGEGNVNAVFSYVGEDRRLHGHVLRVRKDDASKNAPSNASSALEAETWRAIPGLVSPDNVVDRDAFSFNLMRRLIGERFVQEPIQVSLPHTTAASLLQQLRSKGRNPATQSIQRRAILLPDYSLLPQPSSPAGAAACGDMLPTPQGSSLAEAATPEGASPRVASAAICVEIKPKCGFLPTSAFIHPDNAIKRRLPRFRLHQALKAAQGKVTPNWDYDPLDLFSGDAARIQRAFLALMSNPQNNLRLFLDGSPVAPDGLPSALCLALSARNPQLAEAMLAQIASEVLLRSGVLDPILEAQKLDRHDIEAVYPLYLALLSQKNGGEVPPNGCTTIEAIPAPGGGDGAGHIQVLSALLACPRDEALRTLRDYVIAASAKDCSVMLTVREMHSSEDVCRDCVELEGRRWRFRVGVVDLDFKPLAKLRANFELDRQILQAYSALLDERSVPGITDH